MKVTTLYWLQYLQYINYNCKPFGNPHEKVYLHFYKFLCEEKHKSRGNPGESERKIRGTPFLGTLDSIGLDSL